MKNKPQSAANDGTVAQLERDLLAGGLTITQSQVGKTTALCRVLHKLGDTVVIVINGWHVEWFQERYYELFKERLSEDRVLSGDSLTRATVQKLRSKKCKVFIDEYFYNRAQYYERLKWYGAISTMRFPVKVRRFPIPRILIENTLKSHFPEHARLYWTMEFEGEQPQWPSLSP